MKTKAIFTISFLLIVLSSQSQLFQKNYGHVNYYFHDVSTDQLKNNSENLIIAGNFYQTNFTDPLAEIVRIDEVTGDVIWQNAYNDPQGIYMNVRVFDIVAYNDYNGSDLLAITGSVTLANSNYVFVAKVNENGDFLQASYYKNVVNGATHSQGLNIIHTLNGPGGRGFVIGGFANMDYDPLTSDMNRGFVLYVEEVSLMPIWTINVISDNPLSSFEYDMVSDITETNEGFFITGSVGAVGNLFLQQAVLCMSVNFYGDIRWMKSYRVGNSRDVGVDAYYDQDVHEIYLLTNYSYTHYFGVTFINDITGEVDLSRSWYAYDWDNLNRYGFKILKSPVSNGSSLVIAGYIRNGEYYDESGALIQSATIPFAYEFDKMSGDQVSLNYFYHVPYQDPGFSDYFDFWNSQMPLIYYPDMALNLKNETGYFIAGLTGDSTISAINAELIKTDLTHLNLCYRTPIELLHDTIPFIPVQCVVEPANPDFVYFNLTPIPYDYQYEFSCINTAIADYNYESDAAVYPNPSNSTFNFSLQTTSKELVTIQLFDISGRMVQEYQSLSPEGTITIGENLENGIYFAVVKQRTHVKTMKITKVQ